MTAPAASNMRAAAETRDIDGHGPLTFKQYRALVDAEIAGKLGVGLDDLVEFDLWSSWDAGTPPKEAARDAAENESDSMGGLFDELMEDLFE